MTDMPSDPITPLKDAAIQLHEMYRTYIEAGFSKRQAFDLAKSFLLESVRQGKAD